MKTPTKVLVLDDDTKVVFTRLTLKDLFSICDEIQGFREKELRELCKTEDLDVYQTLNVIMDLRRNRPTLADVLTSAGSPKGAEKLLKVSLAKGGVSDKDADVLIEKIGIPDCTDTARMLVLDVQEKKKPDVTTGPGTDPLVQGVPLKEEGTDSEELISTPAGLVQVETGKGTIPLGYFGMPQTAQSQKTDSPK